MSADTLNPSATVTIGFTGLAVFCYNEAFDNNRGRWEIAIPRFPDHLLSVEVTGVGNFIIEPQVKFIEIQDRESIAVAAPTHEVGETVDRKDRDKNINDFRWVTDFTSELPHDVVSIRTKEDDPPRPDVTMLYVYDATAYTKAIDASMLIRPGLEKTGPVVGGRPVRLPDEEVVPRLEEVEDFRFEARVVGMDIQSSGGEAVDILFDRAKKLTVPHGSGPQQILITNLEPPKSFDEVLSERFVESEEFFFGLGDFYRYYELFEVKGDKVHQWGKQPKEDDSGADGNCCCNNIRVKMKSLDAFLR